EHPNTVEIVLKNSTSTMSLIGISLGGGAVSITRIDGFPLRLSGENNTMLIFHRDAYGSVASVTAMLAKHKINIAHMEVSRSEKGQNALMVIETDQKIAENVEKEITNAAHVIKVTVIDI
ncbi:MAG: ACT domain-containing protein, partial [Christensenellaceae bacterium]|nr:ACT domain-containing protein [Christensenellaceae bacterium]